MLVRLTRRLPPDCHPCAGTPQTHAAACSRGWLWPPDRRRTRLAENSPSTRSLLISTSAYPARQSPSFGRPTLPVLTKCTPLTTRCHGLCVCPKATTSPFRAPIDDPSREKLVRPIFGDVNGIQRLVPVNERHRRARRRVRRAAECRSKRECPEPRLRLRCDVLTRPRVRGDATALPVSHLRIDSRNACSPWRRLSRSCRDAWNAGLAEFDRPLRLAMAHSRRDRRGGTLRSRPPALRCLRAPPRALEGLRGCPR